MRTICLIFDLALDIKAPFLVEGFIDNISAECSKKQVLAAFFMINYIPSWNIRGKNRCSNLYFCITFFG